MSSDFRQGVVAGILFSALVLWAVGNFGKLFAGETVTSIVVTGFSYHFAKKAEDCQFNPGLGIQQRTNRLAWHVGLYSNSDCRLSGYAGPSLTERVSEHWRAGVAALCFTGYHDEKKDEGGQVVREDKMKCAPVIVLAYAGKKQGINFGYIPSESILAKLGIKDDDKGEKFKGLLFVQFEVIRW